jgi:hypothetical protein
MLFPVLVLTKTTTISGQVTSGTGFVCFAATVPTSLKQKHQKSITLSKHFHHSSKHSRFVWSALDWGWTGKIWEMSEKIQLQQKFAKKLPQ